MTRRMECPTEGRSRNVRVERLCMREDIVPQEGQEAVGDVVRRVSVTSSATSPPSPSTSGRSRNMSIGCLSILEEVRKSEKMFTFFVYHILDQQGCVTIVMLSKSDLLKYTTRIVPLSRLFSNPTYSFQPDLQDWEVVHKDVKNILEENKEYNLLQATQSFLTTGFFAASATGCAPMANGTFPYIDPCRCLDSFLWILHMLGVTKG
jgi:hypothetical protein